LERLFQANYPVRRESLLQEDELVHLTILTGLSREDLLIASDIYFAQENFHLSYSGESSASLVVRIHPTRAAWYCPECLAEAAYHRLIWRPVSSAACLKHICQLVNSCPQCQGPVSVYDVVRLRCSHCCADLRKANPIALAEDEPMLLAQTAMQSWLTGYSMPDLHWPQQPPAALCRLADGLALGVVYLSLHQLHPRIPGLNGKPGTRHNLMMQLSPIQILRAYTLAVQCMVNWPEGFRRFLYWCEPNPRRDPAKSVKKLIAYLGENLWNSESSRYIWNAFHIFSYDRLCFSGGYPEPRLTFEQLPAYANADETAQILGVSKDVLQSLVEKKLISPAWLWRDLDYQFFFKREELQNLSHYI
jgi:hypothetical protein